MPKKKGVNEVVSEPRVFNEAELFFITEKAKTLPAEEIASVLKCTVEEVSQHIPTEVKSNTTQSVASSLMLNQTKSGATAGVSVMTPQASMYNDATRDSRMPKKGIVIKGREHDCVYQPLGNKNA